MSSKSEYVAVFANISTGKGATWVLGWTLTLAYIYSAPWLVYRGIGDMFSNPKAVWFAAGWIVGIILFFNIISTVRRLISSDRALVYRRGANLVCRGLSSTVLPWLDVKDATVKRVGLKAFDRLIIHMSDKSKKTIIVALAKEDVEVIAGRIRRAIKEESIINNDLSEA